MCYSFSEGLSCAHFSIWKSIVLLVLILILRQRTRIHCIAFPSVMIESMTWSWYGETSQHPKSLATEASCHKRHCNLCGKMSREGKVLRRWAEVNVLAYLAGREKYFDTTQLRQTLSQYTQQRGSQKTYSQPHINNISVWVCHKYRSANTFWLVIFLFASRWLMS